MEQEKLKKEQELNELKKSFLYFMEYTDDIVKGYEITLKKYIKTITKFEFKEYNENEIVLTIESHNPGVLVGKKAIVLDALKIFLNNDTDVEQIIKIDLQDCSLWKNLNSVL